MDYHIEKVASAKAEVGEGPVWNPDEKKVYWTDINHSSFWLILNSKNI